MVPIDDVYQKVLAITNKEQRGYITPQEFNLLANKAQFEIFEGYFHDLKTAYYKPKNNYPSSDPTDDIKTKLHHFIKSSEITVNNDGTNSHALPTDLYRIDTLTYKYPTSLEGLAEIIAQTLFGGGEIDATLEASFSTVPMEELSQKKRLYTEMHPLMKASMRRPYYVRIQSVQFGAQKLAFYPDPSNLSDSDLNFITYVVYYWRKPIDPKWGYVIVNGKALYNSSAGASYNFELHKTEEERLVTRILELAGVVIESPQLTEAAMVDKQNTKREQND